MVRVHVPIDNTRLCLGLQMGSVGGQGSAVDTFQDHCTILNAYDAPFQARRAFRQRHVEIACYGVCSEHLVGDIRSEAG